MQKLILIVGCFFIGTLSSFAQDADAYKQNSKDYAAIMTNLKENTKSQTIIIRRRGKVTKIKQYNSRGKILSRQKTKTNKGTIISTFEVCGKFKGYLSSTKVDGINKIDFKKSTRKKLLTEYYALHGNKETRSVYINIYDDLNELRQVKGINSFYPNGFTTNIIDGKPTLVDSDGKSLGIILSFP